MAQVRDSIIKSNGSSITKAGGGVPKTPSPSVSSADKIKQRQFYRSYSSGLLDTKRITNDGWKAIYEYELENGITTPDKLNPSIAQKYNIDTSLGRPAKAIAQPVAEEPIKPVEEKQGFLDKILGSLKGQPSGINIDTGIKSRSPLINPVAQQVPSSMQAKPQESVDLKNKIENKDPLLMALNNKLGNSTTSGQIRTFLDEYNKKGGAENNGPSYLNGGTKNNQSLTDQIGYTPKSPLVNPNAAHTTQQSFDYDGKIAPALNFKLGQLNAEIGREYTKKMYGKPNKVDSLVKEYETLIKANPQLAEQRRGVDKNFWRAESGYTETRDAFPDRSQIPQSPDINAKLNGMETINKWEPTEPINPVLHWKLGSLQTELGFEATKMKNGKENRVAEIQKQIDELIASEPELQRQEKIDWTNAYDVLAKGVQGASEMAPMQLAKLANMISAGTSGAISGATTAAILGQAGPQVVLGEEVATVPAMAALGFKSGVGLASYEKMYELEGGHAYIEMLEEGLPEEQAKIYSDVVGMINAGIEVNQIGDFIKSMPGVKQTLQAVTKKGLKEATEKFVKNEAKNIAKDYAKFIFSETGQEVVQEIVPITATGLAKGESIGDIATDPQNLQRVLDTAEQSLATFIVMGLSGVGANTATTTRNNKKVTEVFNQMDTVEKTVDGITFSQFQALDENSRENIESYKLTLDTALKNDVFDETGREKAQRLSDKISGLTLDKSIDKEEAAIISDKSDQEIHSEFKDKLDMLDRTRKGVAEISDENSIQAASKIKEFMDNTRIKELLSFFNGVDTSTPKAEINSNMGEFNSLYDKFFDENQDQQAEEIITPDEPVAQEQNVEEVKKASEVEETKEVVDEKAKPSPQEPIVEVLDEETTQSMDEDTKPSPAKEEPGETMPADEREQGMMQRESFGAYEGTKGDAIDEYAKFMTSIDKSISPFMAKVTASTRIKQLEGANFKVLEKVTGGENNPNRELLGKYTGMPVDTDEQVTAAIRSLDPEKYDQWKSEGEVNTDDDAKTPETTPEVKEVVEVGQEPTEDAKTVSGEDSAVTTMVKDEGPEDQTTPQESTTIQEAEAGQEEAPATANHAPSQQIADKVKDHLGNGEKFSYVTLFNYADKAYNGTQANHDYVVKDAYDSLELGVNQHLLNQESIDLKNDESVEVAMENSKKLDEVLSLIPTQSSKRTVEMEQYQQFSTPPNIAYVANWVANISEKDTVLEPSAGIGGLAVFAKAKGANVVVNELSERRLNILRNMPFDGFFNENAEHIDNILPDSVKPTVVVMNPPFSATAGRTSRNSTANAKMHIEQALNRLEPGGRLVGIVGYTMGEGYPAFAKWWKDIKGEYDVRANITIDGKNYKKYGTTYDVNLIVIDKTGATTGDTLTGKYENLEDAIRSLEGIRNDRNEAGIGQVQQDADKPARKTTTKRDEGGTGNRKPSPAGLDDGRDRRAGAATEGTTTDGNIRTDENTAQVSDENTDARRGSLDKPGDDEVLQGTKGRDVVSSGQPEGPTGQPRTSSEIKVGKKSDKKVVDSENMDRVFSDYTPSKVDIKGAKPHKGKLSESTAMGAVLPPDPSYAPNIPRKIIDSGDLSDAQLEAIVYAGQSHNQMLPDGSRRGFFIGDGTGVGKGREISGIILDNYNKGRKKSVWLSVNKELFPDAQRDIAAMGMKKDHVFQLPKKGAKITQQEGTLFVPYGTFKMEQAKSKLHNQSFIPNKPYSLDMSVRLDQMVDWLGHDFDGVVVFDESHKMANAVGKTGSRGKTKPSQIALAGALLQQRLPNARVVYVSATGASEVSNLAYLSRLGMWGEGTPFTDVNEFLNAIGSGGVSAMELVARDMKAMGAYVARSLSYDDVTYERVEHSLNKDQLEAYKLMSDAWQVVMQNMEKALESTNAPSRSAGNARSAFWGSQQRFFNQILVSDSMPTTLDNIQKDVDDGKSVVIQLTSTNEALQNRQIAKAQEENIDLEDIDMSPKDMLIEYLNRSFPVEQFETYVNEYGDETQRPVVDSNGKPVLNKEAVRARDEMIEMVASINMPDSPIDMIINKFGAKNVAEITGRSRRLERIITKNGVEKSVLRNRTKLVRDHELDEFINDKRRILIFSQAGGTGKSYHASNDYKNNHPRVHYMLESGFNVMNAMQGLGRTHRTNQKSAPHVKLITTSVPGHKRFISTIARRFDQLGALTRGQRDAASQGLFNEKDNLEGPTARDALKQFYTMLHAGRFEYLGLSGEDVFRRMGIERYLVDEYGKLRTDADEMTDVKRFLNRLLVLDIDLQDRVFEAYSDILEQSVERAIEKGTLDVGLENFKADSVKISDEVTIRTDPNTGAETKLVSFDIKESVPTMKFEDIDTENPNFKGFYRNTRSGIVRAYFVSRSITDESGKVEVSYRTREPDMGKVQRVKDSDLKKDTVEEISIQEARDLWNDQLKEVPKFKESEKHIITGVLLPIWDKVTNENSKTRVMRVIADDGSEHLGLLVRDDDLNTTMQRLNVKGKKKDYSAMDVYGGVLDDNKVAELSNGWKIKRSRVAGDNRIEVIGPNFNSLSALKGMGVFTEVISSKTRYFIPTTKEKGTEVLGSLLSNREVTRMYSGTQERASIPNTSKTRASISMAAKQPRSTKATEAPKAISSIINEMKKDFRMSVSSKRFRAGRGATGTYNEHSGSIRVKMDNDMNVVAHELGHHLDKKYNLSRRFESYISEMELGLDIAPAYKKHEIPGEVIAEFIRLYLTTEQGAQRLSMDFYNAFRETVGKKDLENLDKHSKDIREWYSANTINRAKSTIRSHTDKKHVEFDKAKVRIEMTVFDDLAPIRILSEAVEEMGGEKLDFRKNPYVLAMHSRRAGEIAKSQIDIAMTDTEGNRIDIPLKDIVNKIDRKNRQDFDAYLKIAHAITLDEYGKRVFSDDFTMDDLVEAKAELERDFPEFVEASKELYRWWGKFIEEWVVKPGLMDVETWQKIQKQYPTYVPNFRASDERMSAALARRGFGNQKSPIKRMKGSAKDTYSAMESFILYTDKIVKVQKRNEVGQAVHEAYIETEDLGDWMTKITHESQLNKFNAIDLKVELIDKLANEFMDSMNDADRAAAKAIRESGDYNKFLEFLSEKGYGGTDIIDNTIDNIITYFTPRMFSTDSNVYTIIDKQGNTHFYEVHDQQFLEAMLNLNKKDIDGVVRIVGAIKRAMTNLITGANPIFGVFTNIWADTPEAYVYGNYKNPFEFGADLIKSIFKVMKKSDDYKAYKAMGGGFSSAISENRQVMTEMLNIMYPDMKKSGVKNMANYALSLIEQFNEAIESAPRLTIYNRNLELYGDNYEGRMIAMWRAGESTTNFLRHGNLQKTVVGQGVPFMNAGLQGLYKLNRDMIRLKGVGKNDLKDGKRVKDWNSLKVIATKALVSITMLELMMMAAYDDDDDYKKLPEYVKDGYWLFKMDDRKFFKIRKPRQLSVMFGSTFRRGIRSAIKDDPDAWEGFTDAIMTNFVPPLPWQDHIAAPFVSVATNKSWSGSPIVPLRLQNLAPSEQHDTNTTEVSKFVAKGLSEKFGIEVSPKKMDYLFQQYSGVIGQIGIPAMTKDKTVGDMLERKMVADVAYSNKVVNDFYEERDKLNQAYATYNSTGRKLQDFDPVKRYRYTQIGNELSDMFKEINAIKENDDLTKKERETKEREIRLKMLDLTDPGNLKPTPYDEFKVLYNRGQDITSEYKAQFEKTGIKPNYNEDEAVLLNMYNIKVNDGKSELGYVNYQIGQVNKRIKEVEGAKTLPQKQKEDAIRKLNETKDRLAKNYMDYYWKNYGLEINSFFK